MLALATMPQIGSLATAESPLAFESTFASLADEVFEG